MFNSALSKSSAEQPQIYYAFKNYQVEEEPIENKYYTCPKNAFVLLIFS